MFHENMFVNLTSASASVSKLQKAQRNLNWPKMSQLWLRFDRGTFLALTSSRQIKLIKIQQQKPQRLDIANFQQSRKNNTVTVQLRLKLSSLDFLTRSFSRLEKERSIESRMLFGVYHLSGVELSRATWMQLNCSTDPTCGSHSRGSGKGATLLQI